MSRVTPCLWILKGNPKKRKKPPSLFLLSFFFFFGGGPAEKRNPQRRDLCLTQKVEKNLPSRRHRGGRLLLVPLGHRPSILHKPCPPVRRTWQAPKQGLSTCGTLFRKWISINLSKQFSNKYSVRCFVGRWLVIFVGLPGSSKSLSWIVQAAKRVRSGPWWIGLHLDFQRPKKGLRYRQEKAHPSTIHPSFS